MILLLQFYIAWIAAGIAVFIYGDMWTKIAYMAATVVLISLMTVLVIMTKRKEKALEEKEKNQNEKSF